MLTPERRVELRRRIRFGREMDHTNLLIAFDDLTALLDAADERDRLAGVLAATPVTRSAAAYGWDRAIASLQYEDGTSVEIVTQSNPFASRPPEEAHAYLPVTEDADGLTCDICGAELADWAAADEHVETHEGWVG